MFLVSYGSNEPYSANERIQSARKVGLISRNPKMEELQNIRGRSWKFHSAGKVGEFYLYVSS